MNLSLLYVGFRIWEKICEWNVGCETKCKKWILNFSVEASFCATNSLKWFEQTMWISAIFFRELTPMKFKIPMLTSSLHLDKKRVRKSVLYSKDKPLFKNYLENFVKIVFQLLLIEISWITKPNKKIKLMPINIMKQKKSFQSIQSNMMITTRSEKLNFPEFKI